MSLLRQSGQTSRSETSFVPFSLLLFLHTPQTDLSASIYDSQNFWRGDAYNSYVEFLDKKGGFYYERWGDAPVHSIGAALFAKKEQIVFFEDIGYTHNPFSASLAHHHPLPRCLECRLTCEPLLACLLASSRSSLPARRFSLGWTVLVQPEGELRRRVVQVRAAILLVLSRASYFSFADLLLLSSLTSFCIRQLHKSFRTSSLSPPVLSTSLVSPGSSY